MGEPTPRPWEYDGKDINHLPGKEPWAVTVVGQEQGRAYESYGPLILSSADAELIVRAVNSHDALVEALRNTLAIALTYGLSEEHGVVIQARAALKLAGHP